MPSEVTVWAARLGNHVGEPRGKLSLTEDALVFRHDKGHKSLEIPLESIRSVRRGFVSPVLIIHWEEKSELEGVAIFFAQPPPLEDPAGGRRRAHRRRSAQYLVGENAVNRGKVREWRKAIQTAVKEASARG